MLDYLQHQETYAKLRPANTRFPKRKVLTHSSHHQWQADLCDMCSLSKYNDNVNYILTVIDVFLRYAYALLIRNKTGDHVTEAFAELFKKETPQLLQTDKGAEFISKKDTGSSQNTKREVVYYRKFNQSTDGGKIQEDTYG